LSKRTVEQMKYLGPVGERAIGVLVSAMEDEAMTSSAALMA
jgi:hypothetical protein